MTVEVRRAEAHDHDDQPEPTDRSMSKDLP
jgi:hypothetical protein